MRKERKIRSKNSLAIVLGFAAFLLAFTPAMASAQNPADGIPSAEKLSGFQVGTQSFTGCPSPPCYPDNPYPRSSYLDPYYPDVFIIMWYSPSSYSPPLTITPPGSVPAFSCQSTTVIPSTPGLLLDPDYEATLNSTTPGTGFDPMAFMKASLPSYGVHYINRLPDQTDPTSLIKSIDSPTITQNAIRFDEDSCDANSSIFGQTAWGTPNNASDSLVWTLSVQSYVTARIAASNATTVCYETTSITTPRCCSTSASSGCDASPLDTSGNSNYTTFLQNLDNLYLNNVFAHEAGHQMQLVPSQYYNLAYGGYHYPVNETSPYTPTIMNQYVYYKISGKKRSAVLTWYIGDRYATTDTPVLSSP